MHRSGGGSGYPRRILIAVAAALIPMIAGCEAGANAPSLHWHQPTDVFATYSDKDFRLGLNAAQTTLGAVATWAGVTLKR